jgi:hypothetical protein
MKITLKLYQIIDAHISLKQIARFQFRNPNVTYAVTKNIRITAPFVEDYEKVRHEIMQQFGGVVKDNMVTFVSTDIRKEFQIQHDSLIEKEEELDIWPISLSGLLAHETDITAEQLQLLDSFIQNDFEEKSEEPK